MARRQRAEGFESNKKLRKQAKLNRAQNTRTKRETLIIACEDSVSAPLYFNAIFNDLKKNHAIAASSLIIAKHKHTDPCGVLQDLQNHKGYEEFDHQWIVIDRDEERTNIGGHTLENFKQAIRTAESKGIKVAYSNPCFEIWYLLHFEDPRAYIDREKLEKQLERDYQYTKKELFTLVLNQNLQTTAINNAKKLLSFWKNTQGGISPATDNPSTTVHELIKLLNSFKDETQYLLSTPANAQRLLHSLEQARSGRFSAKELIGE